MNVSRCVKLSAAFLVIILSSCTVNVPSTANLDPEVEAAINEAVDSLQASVQAALTGAQAVVDGLAGISEGAECPTVTPELPSSFTIDYGTGCESTLLGGATVSGSIFVTLNQDSSSSVLLNNFTTDQRSLHGSITVGAAGSGGVTGITFDLTVDGSTNLTGNGDFTVQTNQQTLTIAVTLLEGSLAVTQGDTTDLTVTASNVLSTIDNTAGDGSAVPSSGTITIVNNSVDAAAPGRTITVTFTAASPINGTVQVQVGNAPAVTYRLPG